VDGKRQQEIVGMDDGNLGNGHEHISNFAMVAWAIRRATNKVIFKEVITRDLKILESYYRQ